MELLDGKQRTRTKEKETEDTMEKTEKTVTVSMIDKAVAAAKAKAEAKAKANGGKAPVAKEATVKTEKAPKAAKVEKAKPSESEIAAAKAAKDAERAAEKAKRDADRIAAKAARDAERASKKETKAAEKAAKAAGRKPAHMAKVEKAFSKLPKLDDATKSAFDLVTGAGLSEGQMAVLAAHIGHYNRVRATERSLSTKLTLGQTVEIVSSDRDPRLIGLRGTVSQVRKIRVLVTIPGHTRDAYLFSADVLPCAAELVSPESNTSTEETGEPTFIAPEATGTEGD